MTVTEQLMKPGSWALGLIAATPRAITALLNEFGHLVITPTQMAPLSAFSDTQLKAAAMYVGVLTGRDSPTQLVGQGLGVWLGDADGKGQAIEALTTISAATLSSAFSTILPAGSALLPGTVTNTSLNTVSLVLKNVSVRDAINQACLQAGAEWRVNYDGTIDAAKASTLFTATSPRVVVERHPTGQDVGYRGLQNVELAVGLDATEWSSRIVALGRGEGAAIPSGGANIGSNPYLDYRGNAARMVRFVEASEAADATAAANVASTLINLYSSPRTAMTLSDDTYAIPTYLRPGDSVWVWDPESGVVDTANQIRYRGETIFPRNVRVYGYTWPVQRGLGVYYRDKSGVYTDLTDWVDWESGATTYDVGAPRNGLSGENDQSATTSAQVERSTRGAVVAASSVISTNGTGDATINYGVTFPAAPVVVVSNGDKDIPLTIHIFDAPGVSSFSVRCYTLAGAAHASSNARVNWMAFG